MSTAADITRKASGPSVLLIICLTGLPQLSETIYTPALPNIALALNTTQHWVQWTLSIYFIGFAAGVFLWGWLSDYIGRRRAMHGGYLVYIAASLLSASAKDIHMLLLARCFQAFGASVGSVITQAVLRDRFMEKQRHQLFSIVGYALAVAPVLGPLIGGFVVQWFQWSANLSLLAVLGIGVLVYSWLSLPETHPIDSRRRQPKSLSQVFIWLLTDRYVLTSALLVGGFNGLLFSYYAEAPFIFINILELKPGQYGLLGFVIAAGYLVGSTLSHRLNEYCSPHVLINAGCGLSVLGSASLLLLSLTGLIVPEHQLLSVVLVLTPMFLVFVAFSLSVPNILSTALTDYSHVTGMASSIFGLFYYILIGFITFIMGCFHAASVVAMPLYFLALSLIMLAANLLRLSRI